MVIYLCSAVFFVYNALCYCCLSQNTIVVLFILPQYDFAPCPGWAPGLNIHHNHLKTTVFYLTMSVKCVLYSSAVSMDSNDFLEDTGVVLNSPIYFAPPVGGGGTGN